jgi:hypothetical protein
MQRRERWNLPHPPDYSNIPHLMIMMSITLACCLKSRNNITSSRLFSSVKIGTVPWQRLWSKWLRILLLPLSHQTMMRWQTTFLFEGVSARVIGENRWSRHESRVNCYFYVMSLMSLYIDFLNSTKSNLINCRASQNPNIIICRETQNYQNYAFWTA